MSNGGAAMAISPVTLLDAVAEQSQLGAFHAQSECARCLVPLLTALNWKGRPRHLLENLPHFADTLDLVQLRDTMANLGYGSKSTRLNLKSFDERIAPFLFIPDRGAACVVLAADPEAVRIFDGADGEERTQPWKDSKGTAFLFEPLQSPEDVKPTQRSWFLNLMKRFRAVIFELLGIGLVLNLLALVTPLFVMIIYDRVVPSASLETLGYLGLGVIIAIACDLCLRWVKAKIVAYLGARIEILVGNAIFEKILYLSPSRTETASIGAQMARMKEFEAVRNFFTSPLALVALELPFLPFFIVVIALLGGILAIVPLLVMAAYIIFGAVIIPRVRASVRAAREASSARQSFLVEALSNMRPIRLAAAGPTWEQRYQDISASAAMNSFRMGQMVALVRTVSHTFILVAGIATMALGAIEVLDGNISVGALIACMALVWRVLAPLEMSFISMTRFAQVNAALRDINELMRMPGEREPSALDVAIRAFKGRVTFSRVSLRYPNQAEPAVMGLSFDIPPGQVVAITGASGSGKSTLLKLAAGMYQPQAGNIRLDSMNIQQLDTAELRQNLGYAPQLVQFFHGTIAQNLRLAEPGASQAQIEDVTRRLNVYDEIMALPEGFDTRIGDQNVRRLSLGLLQRLSLARAFLRDAPVLLLDEPGNALDSETDKALMQVLREVRGKRTVLMVSHRPSHMRIADRVIVMDHGAIVRDGTPNDILAQLLGQNTPVKTKPDEGAS